MILSVLLEHLGEASWLYDVRASLMISYNLEFPRLAEWDERWAAHVDGLVIGEEHSRPLLEDALKDGDEGSVCAAAAVLAEWGSEGDRIQVESYLLDPEAKHRDAFCIGLSLAPSLGVEKWMRGWVGSENPHLVAAGLEGLRFRGIALPCESLRPLFRADDQSPKVLTAAQRMVGHFKVPGCTSWIEMGFESPDDELREASLEAGSLLSVRGVRERWRRVLGENSPGKRIEDLERLGALGQSEDLGRLLEALGDPALCPGAIRGLAWLGHPGAAQPLLEQLEVSSVAPLAAHAFSTMFGVDLDSEEFAAPPPPPAPDLTPEEEEAALKMDEHAGLPRPDPAAVRKWWSSNQARFKTGIRWRGGREYSPSQSFDALRVGRLADRSAAALEVALAITDAPLLEIRDLAPRQSRRIESLLATAR